MIRGRIKTGHILAFILVPAVLLIILALAAAIYVFFLAPTAAVSIPEIDIQHHLSQGQVVEGSTVLITARSRDPDGIEKAELWVNGELISSQVNELEGGTTFASSHVWRALSPGFYSVAVRAFDADGYVGESDTQVIEAVASDPETTGEITSSYFVQEGDTLASIAEQFQTDQEGLGAANPGLEGDPQPGSAVFVPQPAEPEDDNEADDVPGVSASGSSAQPAGSPNQAQPASPPPWAGILGAGGSGSLLNNGSSTLCDRLPSVCNLPRPGQMPPAAPTAVIAQSTGSCQVDIQWTDEADSEDGFQIIRINQANQNLESTIARLDASEGSGQALSYQYDLSLGGIFVFYVQAYNSAGTASSAPSQPLQVDCEQVPADQFPLEVELLELNVSQEIELLHCFVAVGNQPYIRVPSDSGDMQAQAGSADIAAYLGGEKSIRLLVDPSQALDIKVDCVEHQRPAAVGGLLQSPPTAVDLGQFSNSHPAEEWDGRRLTGESSLGEYSIAYRIQAQDYQALNGTTFGGGFLAAPQITGLTDSWIECWMPLTCQWHGDQGFSWTWNPPADRYGDEEHILRLWAKEATQSEPTLMFETERLPVEYWRRHTPGRWPSQEEICARFPVTATTPEGARYHTVTYYIQIEYFTHWGASVLSPPSPTTGIAQFCDDDPVAFEVTLLDITAKEIKDAHLFAGTPNGEMYGNLYFGYEIHWNSHPIGVEPGLTAAPPPSTQELIPGTFEWSRMWLEITDPDGLSEAIGSWSPPSGFSLDNNVFYVPYFENSREDIFFFEDHDGWPNDDDVWCVGFYPWAEGSRDDWLATNETITVDSAEGNCSITFKLRGVRVGGAE